MKKVNYYYAYFDSRNNVTIIERICGFLVGGIFYTGDKQHLERTSAYPTKQKALEVYFTWLIACSEVNDRTNTTVHKHYKIQESDVKVVLPKSL